MAEVTKQQIEAWLLDEEDEFYIDKFREKHKISPEHSNFYKAIGNLCKEKRLKRKGRGLYKQLKVINPARP